MSFLSNGLDWLKSQFQEPIEEEEELVTYDDEVDESQRRGALPARSIRPLEVVIMTPAKYSDARYCVDALEKGLFVMVLLNENVDDETASRFVDFISGAVYLAHGSIDLLNDNVLLVAPDSVKMEKDQLLTLSGIPVWKGP